MAFTLSELVKSHDRSQFDCGRPSLNEWFHKQAWQSQRSESAKVYVALKDEKVVGYHAIAAAHIAKADATKRVAQGQPSHIPAIKIARLAVDTSAQGMGLGAALLKDALLRCASAADIIGAHVVIVDALDESVISFYTRYGFETGPDNDLTMMLLMKDLRVSLANE